MATSGSVDFTVNRNEIIIAARQMIGKWEVGQTMSAEDVDVASTWLNLIVKQWQGTADFAPGLKMWSRKIGYVFLQTGQSVYSIGPSGDPATSSYSQTTISANEAGGQTALSVTTNTGMTAADSIGIILDTGAIHWTTIVSTGGGPIVNITAALPSQASAGNTVYWFTTQIRRPIQILIGELRDSNVKDTPLYQTDVYGYEAITDKTANGDPTQFYYNDTLENGTIYFDSQPQDTTKVIRLVFLSNIEDFDASTDTPDYPQEYNLPLVCELAKYIAPIYGVEFTQTMMSNRNDAVAIAKNLNPDTSELYFQPGLE